MNNKYLLSVDIGTESGRAALLTLDGEVVAASSREYPLYCPRAEWAEQNPDDWWNTTVENIKEILRKANNPKVLGIGIGGQMHAPVPVDEKGRLLSDRVLLWCDKRSSYLCDGLKKKYDEKDGLKITGNAMVPAWTGFKIQWLKEHCPEIYNKTYKFLTCKDYLNLRLTGKMYTDYSEASATYLFDAHSKNWSEQLIKLLGLDMGKLPEIVEASKIIGTVTAEAAKATGLEEGIPVVAGGGDMMCILLGAGIAKFGQACDITGTAADISVFIEEPLYDPRLMHIHHVVPGGGWISFGILDAGGGSFKWFKDVFCTKETEEAKEQGVPVYQLLSDKAEAVPPGAEKLLFYPYLLGERTLGSSSSRGVFFGLTPRHEIAHCVRAIMEGVTFDLNQSLKIIEGKNKGIGEIRAIAGGARSSLWCDIKANIYRKTIVTLKNFEGGVVGAAILAGLGVGAYKDVFSATERVISFDRRCYPDNKKMEFYIKLYGFYKELHDEMQLYYKKLAEI
jgi:xylulokinase